MSLTALAFALPVSADADIPPGARPTPISLLVASAGEIKTGHTREAEYTLFGSVERQGCTRQVPVGVPRFCTTALTTGTNPAITARIICDELFVAPIA